MDEAWAEVLYFGPGGCGIYGIYSATPAGIHALLAGEDRVWHQNLHQRAALPCAGAWYVLLVYGADRPAPELLDACAEPAFRALLDYRRTAAGGREKNCYVVRLGAGGAPAAFGEGDPFLRAYFAR